MDITSNNLNERFADDSAPLLERNTLVWGAFLVGVLLGFVAVYIVVAQPMFAQLKQLQQQGATLKEDVQLLVGVRDQAWEAENLLSDLNSLKGQLGEARAAVREIRQLRKELAEESRRTTAARSALSAMAGLNAAIVEQQSQVEPAERALAEIANIQARLIHQHADASQADDALRGIDQVRSDLAELLQLKQQLADQSQNLGTAKSTAGELLSLKDRLIEQGRDAEAARTEANRLFVLQDELAAHADNSRAAFESLDTLLQIKNKLVDQTPQVADAVQNLEILSDFREELSTQIGSLVRLREGLMEVVLLETTIGKVVKSLEPLTQLANVRRLGDAELRAAAKAILDSRSTRLSSKSAAPRELPRTAENDPFGLSNDEPFLKDENLDLGADEPVRLPEPVSLPTGESSRDE